MSEWEELHTQGYRHQLLGEWGQARHCYEQALACKQDYAYAHYALAQLRMMQTRFSEGRELYEWRFAARDEHSEMDWRGLPIARWRGESLAGKHLHFWVEQGFGDVIMYASFLSQVLAQKPARISLSMFPKMISLFARSFPNIVVESLQDIGGYAVSPAILETFPQLLKMAQQSGLQIDLEPMRQDYELALTRGKPDYTAPMGDLMVYGMRDFTPAQHSSAYLKADPQLVVAAKKRLAQLGVARLVGISWHTINSKSGSARNIPLAEWIPLLGIAGCSFVSLQHHVSPQEIERFCAENGCDIIHPPFDVIGDTEELAALTACMDEVITIDNSNVHLAGALGIPTTLLLPKGCDFRWPVLENTKNTLWYNSVAAERQEKPMDWQPVMQRVTAGLRQRASARP